MLWSDELYDTSYVFFLAFGFLGNLCVPGMEGGSRATFVICRDPFPGMEGWMDGVYSSERAFVSSKWKKWGKWMLLYKVRGEKSRAEHSRYHTS